MPSRLCWAAAALATNLQHPEASCPDLMGWKAQA